jgi:hypothetical protein
VGVNGQGRAFAIGADHHPQEIYSPWIDEISTKIVLVNGVGVEPHQMEGLLAHQHKAIKIVLIM